MADQGQVDFSSKYTNANLAPDATPYDWPLLSGLLRKLEEADDGAIKSVAPAVLSAMLCAQARGDAVPGLFGDLISGQPDERAKEIYASMKAGLTLTFPFVGLPHCIPACMGLIGQLRDRNIDVDGALDRQVYLSYTTISPPPTREEKELFGPEARLTAFVCRPGFQDRDWTAVGGEINNKIYRGVGNPEVRQLMSRYFPELSLAAQTTCFGFLMGGSFEGQSLHLAEIIIMGGIAASGAVRQARSHCKAAIGLRVSVEAVQTVVEVAEQVVAWNGKGLRGVLNVLELAEEIRDNLAKEAQK
ncbi:hypothetical protein EDB81DRAFT_950122 [Dactylonectria macrodidyma]|uniref:Uncharacterized protein n=1 Tax=Dactylonectria macrodidyma TaxID=307937 RepID=A0A9P9EAG2_9HYPO|nr:hypothetical protein EDB81DRAFT_950122 [Dactylonectria macrodidyma]